MRVVRKGSVRALGVLCFFVLLWCSLLLYTNYVDVSPISITQAFITTSLSRFSEGKLLPNALANSRLTSRYSLHADSSSSAMNGTQRAQQLLECLAGGRFVINHNDNSKTKADLTKTIHNVWTAVNIPHNLSRADGKCGNISFENTVQRALCDPNGAKPCCYGNKCESKSKTQCTCDNCVDVRQQIHPELADYRLNNKRCHIVDVTQDKPCDILRRKNITMLIMIGDSLIRHVYSGMLILLRNDDQYGALKINTEPGIRQKCSGHNQFTEKACRSQIRNFGSVCNGSVSTRLFYFSRSGLANMTLRFALGQVPRGSVVVNSIGLHDALNETRVIHSFLRPILDRMNSLQNTSPSSNPKTFPMYIWMSPHLPGLLQPPRYAELQGEVAKRRYSSNVNAYVKSRGQYAFDTHSLSRGVFSWDGVHFGMGFNKQVAQILLSFVDQVA